MADLDEMLLEATGRTGRNQHSPPSSRRRRKGSYSDDGSDSKDDDSDDDRGFANRKPSTSHFPLKKRLDPSERDEHSSRSEDDEDDDDDDSNMTDLDEMLLEATGRTGRNQHSPPSSMEPNLKEFIIKEIDNSIQSAVPRIKNQVVEQINEHTIVMVRQEIATLQVSGLGVAPNIGVVQHESPKGCTYRDFSACHPRDFDGSRDPVTVFRWISDMERAFYTCNCPPENKVRYASSMLRKEAQDWWGEIVDDKGYRLVNQMSWDEFVVQFKEQFVSPTEIWRLTEEFLTFQQTTQTVTEVNKYFIERSRFCPEYVASESMKMYKYLIMLKAGIREFVASAKCKTVREMMKVAILRELENVRQQTEASAIVSSAPSAKKQKVNNTSKQGNKKTSVPCLKCNKFHIGICRMGLKGCYRCGREGHIGKDCRSQKMITCFECGQPGHGSHECTTLATQNTDNRGNTPTSQLCIFDGREAKKENQSRAGGIAFQITAEEAEAESDMVAANP